MEKDMFDAIINVFGTDPNKAILVKDGYMVQCYHTPEQEPIFKRTNIDTFKPKETKEIILKKYHDGTKTIGWLGYCYTCEKTYYRE